MKRFNRASQKWDTTRIQCRVATSVVAPLLAGCCVLCVIVGVSLGTSASDWTEDAVALIKNETILSIARMAQSKANFAEQTLESVRGDLLVAKAVALGILQGTLPPLARFPTNYGVGGVLTPNTPWSSTVRGGTQPSAPSLTSAAFIPNCPNVEGTGCSYTNPGSGVTPQQGSNYLRSMPDERLRTMNDTAFLDDVFAAAVSTRRYDAVYYGTSNTGTFRPLPWSPLDSFVTLESECYAASTNGARRVGYDARCREWYAGTAQSRSTFYTKPYVDAITGNTAITAAEPVIVGNNLHGVLGADFSVQKIQDSVIRTKPTKNAYGYVFHSNSRLVILHPDFETGQPPETVENIEFEGNLGEAKDWMDKAASGESGHASYTRKDGAEWVVAYSYVPVSGWSVIITAPMSDLEEAKNKTDDAAKKEVGIVVGVFTGVMAISVAAIIYVSPKITRTATRPIENLTKKFEKLAAGNYDDNAHTITAETKEEEILNGAYKELALIVWVTKIAGTIKNNRGEAEKAKALFAKARDMYTRLNNSKGKTVCDNNEAVMMANSQMWQEAATLLKSCVDDAERNYTASVKGGLADAKDFARSSSLRRANLSHIYTKMSDFRGAHESAQFSIAHAIRTGDLGWATKTALQVAQSCSEVLRDPCRRHTSEGTLYAGPVLKDMSGIARAIHDGRNDGSVFETLWQRAQGAGLSPCPPMPIWTGDQAVIVQCCKAIFALGSEANQGRKMAALPWANSVVDGCDPVDKDAFSACAGVILRLVPQRASEMAARQQEMGASGGGGGGSVKKCISFVVDISGSMSHSEGGINRLEAVKTSVETIVVENVNQGDEVGLVEFDDRPARVLQDPTVITDSSKASFIRTVNRMIIRGGTAMYDAVPAAVQSCKKGRHDSKWIVLLSDGDDRHSRSTRTSAVSVARSSGIPFITIGVQIADSAAGPLKEIANTHQNGRYLAASSVDEISRVFGEVMQHIDGALRMESI
jgi:hypothetical protein